MDLVNRILVPVDFSDCSRRALAYAVALAERLDGSVDLLHVWDLYTSWLWAPIDGVAFDSSRGLLAEGADAGHTLSQWVEEIEQRSRVPVRGRLERGDPLRTILEIAGRDRYDLIVIGTHGRTGLSLILLGSLARKLVQRAPCPVLTVRPPPEPRERAVPARLVT
jgi:nucleotide-binding universal stress UspA family protein